MKLTVFTPTFNRASTISRTYNSLQKQTCKDFEWLIVDDGSTDNTEELICSWLGEDNAFQINYIKQSNGGKYRAYNNGLRNAKGVLFFCVDSDDWLPENSVELIVNHYDELLANNTLAGITALKEFPNKTLIGKPHRIGIHQSSLYNLELIGQGGERSRVFKTHVARQYPFPEETNELFVTESVIYDRYEGEYEFLVTNDVLTTCEYQQEGLSCNPRKLMLKNPAGYKLYFAQRLDMTPYFLERIKFVLQYHAFRLMYGGTAYDYCGQHKILVKLLAPVGFLIKKYYNRNK